MAETATLAVGGRTYPATVLTGPLERARGRMATRTPPERVVVWDYDDIGRRSLHMLCVPYPLRAAFIRDGVVMQDTALRPWVGLAAGRADRVVEYDPARYELAEGESVSLSRETGAKSDRAPLSV